MSELERVRQLVVDCARAWRETPCSSPGVCLGENHVEACTAELARQDLIAALDKLDLVERETCDRCDGTGRAWAGHPCGGCDGSGRPVR